MMDTELPAAMGKFEERFRQPCGHILKYQARDLPLERPPLFAQMLDDTERQGGFEVEERLQVLGRDRT